MKDFEKVVLSIAAAGVLFAFDPIDTRFKLYDISFGDAGIQP